MIQFSGMDLGSGTPPISIGFNFWIDLAIFGVFVSGALIGALSIIVISFARHNSSKVMDAPQTADNADNAVTDTNNK